MAYTCLWKVHRAVGRAWMCLSNQAAVQILVSSSTRWAHPELILRSWAWGICISDAILDLLQSAVCSLLLRQPPWDSSSDIRDPHQLDLRTLCWANAMHLWKPLSFAEGTGFICQGKLDVRIPNSKSQVLRQFCASAEYVCPLPGILEYNVDIYALNHGSSCSSLVCNVWNFNFSKDQALGVVSRQCPANLTYTRASELLQICGTSDVF